MVTARVEPSIDASGLDALQQEGVAVVLDRQLALVEGVAGPSDEDVDVLDYRITVHQDHASVLLAMDAPSLTVAEQAAATVLGELLTESELLASWSVADSEVRITEDEFNQSLAGADDEPVGTESADSQLEAAVEDALDLDDSAQINVEHWDVKLAELAEQLRAFAPSAFRPVPLAAEEEVSSATERATRLAAGALVHAVRVVTDEIFYDELSLSVNNAAVDEAVGLLVLEELPPCYEHRYDAQFARALLLASSTVATRLTRPEWTAPRSVAESLALRLFINEAQVLLEAAELMEWEDSKPLFEAFSAAAFVDTAHEELFDLDIQLPGEEGSGSGETRETGEDQGSGEAMDNGEISDSGEISESGEISDSGVISESGDGGESAAAVEAGLRARGLAFEQWFHDRTASGGQEIHPYLRQM